jgi:hypothetical protein
LEGSAPRAQQSFSYSHVIIGPANLEIHDAYTGASGTPGNGDYVAVPSGVANYYLAVHSFVTVLPGLGIKRVILADRTGTPGAWNQVL